VDIDWERAAIAGAVVVATVILARIADGALSRRLRATPQGITRYRVLRRSVVAAIVGVGVLSALLVIPQVRAVAGSILASSAVVGLIVGFAAQSTLSNFVAGILIAFTQPLRIGDQVTVLGQSGEVEEIGLTYTTIRTAEGARLFVPNNRLASDTITNETIASGDHLAQVTVTVPLGADLDRVVELLAETARAASGAVPDREPQVRVTQLDSAAATVAVDAWAASPAAAAELASRVRLAVYGRLRAEGVFA
jgi:small conductance mechanosensitive channel